jgi:hypothetical protein
MSFVFKGIKDNCIIKEELPVCSRSGLLCGSGCGGCNGEGSGCINACGDKCTGNGAGCDNPHCMILKENRVNNKFLVEGGMTEMGNKKSEENHPVDESRREFLRGAGLVVGSTALLGAGGLAVTGCSISNESGSEEKCTTTTTKTTTVNNVEYLGECICPGCGIKAPHPKGTPCRLVPCPKCGAGMGRFA